MESFGILDVAPAFLAFIGLWHLEKWIDKKYEQLESGKTDSDQASRTSSLYEPLTLDNQYY